MQIAIALYPKFTLLDAIGPFQVFVDLPDVECVLVAEHAGPVNDHSGRGALVATHTFAEVTNPDIIVVPGGAVSQTVDADDPVVQWIRGVHPHTQWTSSVCTGALFLGLAGLLDGIPATTHWAFHDRIESLGAVPTLQRVVEAGKIVTAAGVSSGIDMALVLVAKIYGDDIARAVPLAIEYAPQPPFEAGHPARVDPEIRELVRSMVAVL